MGQNQNKTVINPNNGTNHNAKQNSMPSPAIEAKEQRIIMMVRQALRNCSSGGFVNRDSFNQGLAVLENYGFKRLRDTPLADRLFYLLDKNRNGRILEQDFSRAINQIIVDRNSALTYTFRAYDADADNRVSKRQFTQLIEDSWRAAFRVLATKCDGDKHKRITMADLQAFAKSKVPKLNEASSQVFRKLDPNNTGFIEFIGFKEFVLNSGYNQITASIEGEKVVVPLNLTSLYMS